MPMARCTETGQTVKSNDLGRRLGLESRQEAELQSKILAEQMSAKTKRTWTGYVELYTVDNVGRTRL